MIRRINLVLALALMASALLLVRVAYESRSAFTELDRSRQTARALEAEFKRLDAERQAQATHARVERLARERLAMRAVTPAVTVYVDDVAPAAGGDRP